MADEHGGEEQESFGEASLGEAQSSEPPADPEMVDEDQDAEPASTEDELDPGGERDQAEG